MKHLERLIRRFSANPLGIIALGFAILIVLGSLLLMLPVSTKDGITVNWFEALFTSTSAVCVTGLIVVDTLTTWSRAGQIILLILIQTGGLGFMTFATLLLRLLGKRLTLHERNVVMESMNEEAATGLVELIQWVVMSTFTIELTGAVLLSFRFIPMYGWGEGAFYSIFHAVSAFCNAGFDLMGDFNSLAAFTTDVWVNAVIMGLVIFGGLGFVVLSDLIRVRKFNRFRLHTKIVLVTYFALLFIDFFFVLISEWTNPLTLGELSVPMRFLASLFQSVTLRTAGFNTIPQQTLRPATKLVNCFMMLVGASSASTGGGMKVTTLAVVVLLVRMVAHGKDSITVFNRRLQPGIERRAVTIIVFAMMIALVDILVISMMQPHLDLMDIAYECTSAMGTVGISALGTSTLNRASQVFILITMYLGRIGPLTMAILLSGKQDRARELLRYPEERIMIG